MKKVAVIDSGSGGLNVLKNLFACAHDCQFLFLADEKNAPYGDKDKKTLINIAKYLVDFLNSFFKPDIVVFACNTLTAAAIRSVRKLYPQITFIGCEPAIKPACQKFAENEVLLLATNTTLKCSPLLKKYPQVRTLSIQNLPSLIDQNLFDLDCLTPLLKQHIQLVSPRAIVLGCTHFEAIKPQIKSFCDCQFFGSSEGIGKRLCEFCPSSGGNDCFFMTTGEGDSLAKYYHYFFNS